MTPTELSTRRLQPTMSWLRRRPSPAQWSPQRRAGALVFLVVIAVATALIGRNLILRLQHDTVLEPIPAGSTVAVPGFQRVYLIVLENKSEGDILGNPEAPYLNALIHDGAMSADYQAIAHPSQPNYLALFSGSTQGVIDDEIHDIAGPTIADQLEAADRSWGVFAENLPADTCFPGPAASGGPDGAGEYVRKHNPAISFDAIRSSATRCANIKPLAAFKPDAADFTWIVPNMCHIMHDCPIASGDAWLKSFVPQLLDSTAFKSDRSVLFITFDEGADKSRSNEVVTVALGTGVRAGTRSPIAHSHYSLLRTIEAGLGLPCLGQACDANTLGELFTP